MQIDGKHGVDLLVGSKGRGASVGWLRAPRDPRQVGDWSFHRLYDAGWIMSLVAHDMDRDGDDDVIVSDRKGKKAGVLWLENPGASAADKNAAWKEHRIGADGREVMYLTVSDLNGDKRRDILCATRTGKVELFQRQPVGLAFDTHSIDNPFGIRNGKAVAVGDIDLDGRLDLVHTTNKGRKSAPQPALAWMSYRKKVSDSIWTAHDVSGPEGVKFDLVELIDLDGDGDLDILTCEEIANLGVFWYENPTR